MRGTAGVFAAAGAAVCAAAGAAPASAQESVKVESIRFEGNLRYSEANLKYSMRTKEGKPLDRELLARDLSMLRSFFDEISLKEEPVPGAVRLVFQVRENPLVARVYFLGIDHFTEEELKPLVDTRTGYPLAAYRLENDVRVLERKYRDAGFHFVEVRAETLEEEGARKVIFRVVEGPEVDVEAVRFQGLRTVEAKTLLQVMALRPAGLLSSRPYVERRIEEDRVAVARLLRDEGLLDARVWYRGVDFNADRDEATLTYAVEEGEPWTLGEVQVTGGETIPERASVVEAAAELVPGSRWNRKAADRVVARMEEEARRQGFSDVRIDLEPIPRAEGRVQDLRLAVVEGRRTTVRFISVSGNTITRDKVVLREFTVAPGEPLDSGAVSKSVRRALDTQYFTSVVPVYKDTDRPDQKDVEIRVEENPRTSQFRIGFGVSSDTGLFGTISLTFRNFDIEDVPSSFAEFGEGRAFRGAGQTLSIVAQPGSSYSSYRLAFTEPWLLDQPVSAGFDVYATKSSLFAYDEDRVGASVFLERRWLMPRRDLDDLYTLGLRPRIESIDISHVDDDGPPNAFEVEGHNGLHALALEGGWRRLDQEFVSERGWRVSATTELVGGALGGDIDTWKNSAEVVRVLTLFKDADERAHTVRLRAGAATAWGFRGDPTPLMERWTAGGASGIGAVRGYRYGGLGPHGVGNPATQPNRVRNSIEESRGEPMGGEALLAGSVEYGFPLWSDVLRGAVFFDAGNLQNNTGDLRRDWRASVGFGILVKVPFFGPVPLRFDFGFPVITVDGDERQVLSFEFSRFF